MQHSSERLIPDISLQSGLLKTLAALASLACAAPSQAQTAAAPTTSVPSTTDARASSGSAQTTQASAAAAPAVSALAPVAGQSLALADALGVARGGSFTVGSAQARIEAATARLRGAGARANPTLTIARAFGRNTGGFDEDILLSQVIEIGKRSSRVRGAQAEVAAAQFDRAGVGTDLEFAIRSAYFESLRAEVERTLAQEALQTAQTFHSAAQNQFAAGDVPRANVVRSSIELSRAQSALTQAESERAVRLAAVRSLLGLSDEAPLQLSDTLQFAPVSYDLTALQELASLRRADLQSARAQAQVRQAALQSAQNVRRPDAFIEARRAAIAPYAGAPNGSSLRVGIVIPLLDLGRNRAASGEAQAGVREQEAIVNETTRAARLDVATTFERLVAAQKAVQAFDAGRLAQARELLDMTQIGYERGANSYLELLDAQTVFRTEQADYARALATWNTARADLERAVGGQLP